MLLLEISLSEKPNKKLKAIFETNGRRKTVHFGAKGYEDYTQHHSFRRRENYLKRHASREDWTKPDTPGALSRYILWGDSRNIHTNINKYIKLFNL